jgi:hypothetical protein
LHTPIISDFGAKSPGRRRPGSLVASSARADTDAGVAGAHGVDGCVRRGRARDRRPHKPTVFPTAAFFLAPSRFPDKGPATVSI